MPDRKLVVLRTFVMLVVVGLAAVLIFTPFLREQPESHPISDMLDAKKYADALPEMPRITLTPNNQPVTRFVTAEPIGDQALERLRIERRGLYRPAWAKADIEIIVVSQFLQMKRQERMASLEKFSLRNETVNNLAGADLSRAPGCSAYRNESNGWSRGGFVLVDPTATVPADFDVGACVVAGFNYLLGVPVSGSAFDLQTFPLPEVSSVLLDYIKQCSYRGETEVSPKVASNTGITNFPSVQCISRRIDDALRQ